MYFIDSTTGVDIEVTGGEVTKEKFLESIDKAIEKMQVKNIRHRLPQSSSKDINNSFYLVVQIYK